MFLGAVVVMDSFYIVVFVALTILTSSSFTTNLHSAGAVYIDLVHVIFLMTLSQTASSLINMLGS